MKIEPRVMLAIRFSCAFAAGLLSACASESKPVQLLQPHFTKGLSANLAPNSNTLGGWTLQDYKTQVSIPGKPVSAVYIGTGHPNSASLYSEPIAVVPGHSYMFSAWIDPSRLRISSPVMLVASRDRFTLYGQQIHVSGKATRFSDPVVIPDGVTQVVLAFTNAGSTTPRGKSIVFSAPMFREDGIVRPYAASIEAPLLVYLAPKAAGQSGSATIRDGAGGVSVAVRMNGGSANGATGLAISKGACGAANSSPWKALTALKNGISKTALPGVTLARLKQGTYSLVATAGASKTSVACGNLKS